MRAGSLPQASRTSQKPQVPIAWSAKNLASVRALGRAKSVVLDASRPGTPPTDNACCFCRKETTMKRTIHFLGIAIVMAAGLALANARVEAGRTGGPKSLVATAPGGASVYFDIPFAAGETAAVAITGDGNSIMHVIIYDSDGNMVIGDGNWDRRTAL